MVRNKPFFIFGCVRSGTTMLRNILRMHPNLAAPEETHFYRWSEPYGTTPSMNQLRNNNVLQRHRQIDRIDGQQFDRMLEQAATRRELLEIYMRRYIEIHKPGATRWFDKTPQNVYGAAMLVTDFPGSRFVHIVRNPVDVAISLRIGRVMKVESLVGACNYWREAASIIRTIKLATPRRVHELRYEDFNADPKRHVAEIMEFIREPYEPSFMDAFVSEPSVYDHCSLLSKDERRIARGICGKLAREYGYEI